MVNILVLGGTGPTGIALIKESIARGHTVVVFARSPQKLPEEISTHPLVVVVTGSLDKDEDVRRAFTASYPTQINSEQVTPQENINTEHPEPSHIQIDAVISALGPPVKKIHPSGHPIAKGYERVVRIGKEYGVSRFIVLGTASIVDAADRFDARFKALVLGVEVFAPHAYEDVVEIGKVFERLDIDWTIARVPLLIQPKEGEGSYNAGYIGDGHTSTWLSRPKFASFVLDEIVNPQWIHKRPLVSLS